MTSVEENNGERLSQAHNASVPRRRLRNYLLVPGFQLKYTGMVVLLTILVTASVGSWLGYRAYELSRGMTQMLTMQRADSGVVIDDDMQALFEAEAERADEELLGQIVSGILILIVVLTLTLGFIGVIVTHKVVGPAYKLKMLMGEVARGNLSVRGSLRKGDELQDVADAFWKMVRALRERREEDIREVDALLTMADAVGVETLNNGLLELRERLHVQVGSSETESS